MLFLTQNVEHKFDEVMQDARFTFLGNVAVTADRDARVAPPTSRLALDDLAPHYTHLLLAYGASDARRLVVPGSERGALRQVHTALEFVQWYNGHPDAHGDGAPPFFDVDADATRHVAVVGAGNVAVDVVRMLLSQTRHAPSPTALAHTDVPQPVLECLRTWRVEEVGMYVRRGLEHVAFTNKELREMLALPHAPLAPLDASTVDAALAHAAQLREPGPKRALTRMLQQLKKGSKAAYSATHVPRWALHLLHAPRAFLADAGGARVARAEWDLTRVTDDGRATPSGATTTTPADLVLTSIGYRSQPLPGASPGAVPFDMQRSIVPNERRRVTRDGVVVPGMYVAGWLATGPIGVIVSTMVDAYSAADEMVADWRSETYRPLCAAVQRDAAPGVPAALRDQRVVHYEHWRRIDAAERERGRPLGKEREKLLGIEVMLEAAHV